MFNILYMWKEYGKVENLLQGFLCSTIFNQKSYILSAHQGEHELHKSKILICLFKQDKS